MTLLEKHRYDYKKLKKSELIEIIEEMLKKNEEKKKRHVYNPLNTVWNNNRTSIRKQWSRRSDPKVRERIRKKIKILRSISDEDKKIRYIPCSTKNKI